MNAKYPIHCDRERDGAGGPSARCIKNLRTIPLLEGLEDVEFEAVMEAAECRRLKRGEFLFRAGEPADRFYVVCEGRAKIYHNTADGREQILYVYREGDFIGGLNLLMAEQYQYMGEALEDSSILVIPKTTFDRHMADDAAVLRGILEQSFARIRWAEDMIERLSRHTAAVKTAALLLRLVRDIGVPADDGYILQLRMNREELGSYAGLTRESITRQLSDFRAAGYIDWYDPQNILVTGVDELQAILEE